MAMTHMKTNKDHIEESTKIRDAIREVLSPERGYFLIYECSDGDIGLLANVDSESAIDLMQRTIENIKKKGYTIPPTDLEPPPTLSDSASV